MDKDLMPRRVVVAAAAGTALEWYDFILYGTASALVLGRLFFPSHNPTVATLGAFATFAVGFLFRPLGGLVFGHFGDRIGRKKVLVLNLAIMGTASTLMGLLPTYKTIGVAAPILLVVLRIIQGFGAGAEYAGAGAMAIEYSRPGRRGLFGSTPGTGAAVGSLMSAVAFVIATGAMSRADFLSWGWRIPFVISILLVGIGIYVRSRLAETPSFQRAAATASTQRIPVVELLRKSPKNTLLGILASIGPNIGIYMPTVFGVSYITKTVGVSERITVIGLVIAYLVGIFVSVGAGAISDRFGSKRVYILGALFSALFTAPFFWLVDTGAPVLIWLAFLMTVSIGFYIMAGTQGALIAELFPTRTRYTGIAICREFSAAATGGTAPMVGAILLSAAGGTSPWLVAGYTIALLLIVAGSAALLPKTSAATLDELDADTAAARPGTSMEATSRMAGPTTP